MKRFGFLLISWTVFVLTMVLAPGSAGAVSIEYIGEPGQQLYPATFSPNGESVFGDIFPSSLPSFYWSQATGLVEVVVPDGHGYVKASLLSASADGSVLIGNAWEGYYLPSGAIHIDAKVGFRWSADIGFTQLGELSGGPDNSLVRAISADGTTLLGVSESDVGIEAVRWTKEGTAIEPMGYFGISSVYGNVSSPNDLSQDGSTVVGSSTDSNGHSHAFRWTESTGMIPLGASPVTSYWSRANSVSPDGTKVVGEGESASQQPHQAFLWDEATGATQGLGWLPIEDFGYSPLDLDVSLDDSWATAVSDDGSIVTGTSSISVSSGPGPIETFHSEYLPFVWTPSTGIMQPLDFLQQEFGFEGSMFSSLGFTDVSADGSTILASGRDQSDQLLTMLIHLGDEVLLPGDYNDDGMVDAADYAVWRDHMDMLYGMPNDKTPGSVTNDDFQVWRSHFGESRGGAAADATVPEPGSRFFLLLATCCFVAGRCCLKR